MLHLGQNTPTDLQHKTAWNLGILEREDGLGVLVDGELKCPKHVQEQVSDANRILGVVHVPAIPAGLSRAGWTPLGQTGTDVSSEFCPPTR